MTHKTNCYRDCYCSDWVESDQVVWTTCVHVHNCRCSLKSRFTISASPQDLCECELHRAPASLSLPGILGPGKPRWLGEMRFAARWQGCCVSQPHRHTRLHTTVWQVTACSCCKLHLTKVYARHGTWQICPRLWLLKQWATSYVCCCCAFTHINTDKSKRLVFLTYDA